MKTVTIYASTDHATVWGQSATYSTARSTATRHLTMIDPDYDLSGSGYYVVRGFLRFDTSVIPDEAVLVNAQLRMTGRTFGIDRSFSIEVVKHDWSGEDPIDAANRDTAFDGSLAGTMDVSVGPFSPGIVPTPQMFSSFLDLSQINKDGDTYYSLRSSRDSDDDEPTGEEYVMFLTSEDHRLTYRPALIVNYYEVTDPDTPKWWLFIDWDGFEDEADRMTRFRLDRGRDTTIGAPGKGFEGPQVGRLIVDLDNWDNRYDPWNRDGPLYGKIRPGARVNFALAYQGIFYNMMTGFVRDIRPKGFRKFVTLTVEDGAGWLRERVPDISMLTGSDVGDAINEVLDNLRYPFGRTVEDGVNNLDYYWTTGKNALTEIHDLAASDFGRFSVAVDGQAYFRGRYNADAIEHTLTEDVLGKDIYIPMPWDYSRDIVDVMVYPRVAGSSDSVVWTLRDNPTIAAGATLELWAEYRYEGQATPALNVYLDSITPFATGDVRLTTFSRNAKIEVTNSGASSATLTELVLKGTPIYSPDALKISKEQEEVVIPAAFVFDYAWLGSINTAEDFANILLAYLVEAKQYPEVTIWNRPELACPIDLEQRLRLVLDTYDIDQTFFVNKITHTSGASMSELITRVKLTPMLQDQSDDVLILDSAERGLLDTNTLGF